MSVSLSAQKYIVIIDAGHGGRDPGNLASFKTMSDEKHINLDIALKVGELITENIENVKVVYTRDSDKSVSLDDRAYIANKNEADFFISIHSDSHSDSDINGCRVHIHDGNLGESKKLANSICLKMNEIAGRKNLGVQDSWQRGGHYFVLKNTAMPAVLVECGFMTNELEEIFLNSEKGKNLVAKAIYKGFEEFLSNLKGKTEKVVSNSNQFSTIKAKFKVQISASTEAIPFSKFKNLDMKVEEVFFEEGVFKYKYYVAAGSTFTEAKKVRNKVISKGFGDAFIVEN